MLRQHRHVVVVRCRHVVVRQQQVRRQQLVCDKDSMMVRHLVHRCEV
jgi:hypothetical protein